MFPDKGSEKLAYHRHLLYPIAQANTFAGDTHNAWHTNLTDARANKVGVEFATASVSSLRLEGLLGDDLTVVAGWEVFYLTASRFICELTVRVCEVFVKYNHTYR